MLLTLIMVAALVLAAAVLAVLVAVAAGIHGDERCMSLCAAPRTHTRAVARQILGVHAAPRHTGDIPQAQPGPDLPALGTHRARRG
jgi:hypothetical protein